MLALDLRGQQSANQPLQNCPDFEEFGDLPQAELANGGFTARRHSDEILTFQSCDCCPQGSAANS